MQGGCSCLLLLTNIGGSVWWTPRAAMETGLDAVLEGGPWTGSRETMPRLCHGVMTCRTWPDGDDGEFDYFYPRTKRRDSAGRIICRFSGRKVRA